MADGSSGDESDRLLTAAEVAGMFRVDPKTVSRWGASGRLPATRTPGGHHRYWKSAVLAILARRNQAAPGDPVSAKNVPDSVAKAAWDAQSASAKLSSAGTFLDALAAGLTQAREEIAQRVEHQAGALRTAEKADPDSREAVRARAYRNAARMVRAWPC